MRAAYSIMAFVGLALFATLFIRGFPYPVLGGLGFVLAFVSVVMLKGGFARAFADGAGDYEGGHAAPDINPATGLPMVNGVGSVDVRGNTYGTSHF